MPEMIGAVDIGGTKIAVGLVDDHGRVLRKTQFPTDVSSGFECAMQRISAALSECAAVNGDSVLGIGIGCTGQVDTLTGSLSNLHNLPAWEGRNPVDFLGHEFNVPVAIENDADAAALGEAYCGAAKGK